jgi:hypothetical protein
MDLLQRQIANEFKSTHHLVSHIQEDLIKSGLEHLAKDYEDILVNHIKETDYNYISKGEVKEWTSKKERHENVLEMDLEELSWKVIAMCTSMQTQTFTQCVGKLKGLFKNTTVRQDIEQASECIALLPRLGLITIILPKDTEEGVIMIKSRIQYDADLSDFLTKSRHVMPSLIKPAKLESNKDSGYLTFSSSVILAGKYHNKPVPLDHLNRVNSVALSINPKALEIDPVFDERVGELDKKTGLIETPKKRLERYNAWLKLNVESMQTYAELVNYGNKFYLTYKYDERLRTYSHGYQVSTQGDSYRKSVLELHNKELVRM